MRFPFTTNDDKQSKIHTRNVLPEAGGNVDAIRTLSHYIGKFCSSTHDKMALIYKTAPLAKYKFEQTKLLTYRKNKIRSKLCPVTLVFITSVELGVVTMVAVTIAPRYKLCTGGAA